MTELPNEVRNVIGERNPEECAIKVTYTNYRGETSTRRIIPIGTPYIGSTEYHPKPQYLMKVWDLDKQAPRTYTLKDINDWKEFPDFN